MQPASPEVVAGVLRVPIYDLAHGENARGELGDVTELSNSLKTLGQQQPLLVEPREDGKWSVWDGNRRLKAARQAGFAHMLAIPRKTPMTERQRILRQLGMHSTGKPFDPIAEAKAIEQLMFGDGEKLTREEIARALSKSGGWVKGRVDLLQLNADEQLSVSKGTLAVTTALQMIAGRRGTPSGAKPQAGSGVRCDNGGRCGCVCHKRNMAVSDAAN